MKRLFEAVPSFWDGWIKHVVEGEARSSHQVPHTPSLHRKYHSSSTNFVCEERDRICASDMIYEATLP
jgi:hypothetical protein